MFAAAALATTAGCSLYTNDQPCPCASGWTCCKNGDVCVKNGAACPGPVDGSAPPPTPLPSPVIVHIVIATGQARPTWVGIGPDPDHLPVWLDADTKTLMTIPSFGPTWPFEVTNYPRPDPVKLVTLPSAHVAIDFPYVADDADGTILRVQGSSVTTLATGQVHPRDIVVDDNDDNVYWTDYGHSDTKADGTLARVSTSGGPVQVLASGLAGPGPLCVTPDFVYFATVGKTAGANEILRVPVGGGAVETVATGQPHPNDIAAWFFSAPGQPDQASVYWTTSADASSSGDIMEVHLPGGTPGVFIGDVHHPTQLEARDGWFFLNDGGISGMVEAGTSWLVFGLSPEPGRHFWDWPGDHHGSGAGLLWTDPQEGTIEGLGYGPSLPP